MFDDFERAAYPALRKLWRDDDPMVGSDAGYSSRARPHAPPKPRRSVWRQLLLDRAACEAIWPPRAAKREAVDALRINFCGGAEPEPAGRDRHSASERRPMSVSEHTEDVIPAIILANTARVETIEVLREHFSMIRPAGERSVKEEIVFAEALDLTKRATDCLTTACAAKNLTMVVQDPRTPS